MSWPRQPTRYVHFLYTYKCGSKYTDSFWVQQLVIFCNGLSDRNASGALVRSSTPIDGDIGDAEAVASARAMSVAMMRAAIPHLDRGLP